MSSSAYEVVSPNFDPAAVGVGDVISEGCQCGGVGQNTLQVEASAKAEEYHVEPDFCTLVSGLTDSVFVGQVEKYGKLHRLNDKEILVQWLEFFP